MPHDRIAIALSECEFRILLERSDSHFPSSKAIRIAMSYAFAEGRGMTFSAARRSNAIRNIQEAVTIKLTATPQKLPILLRAIKVIE